MFVKKCEALTAGMVRSPFAFFTPLPTDITAPGRRRRSRSRWSGRSDSGCQSKSTRSRHQHGRSSRSSRRMGIRLRHKKSAHMPQSCARGADPRLCPSSPPPSLRRRSTAARRSRTATATVPPSSAPTRTSSRSACSAPHPRATSRSRRPRHRRFLAASTVRMKTRWRTGEETSWTSTTTTATGVRAFVASKSDSC